VDVRGVISARQHSTVDPRLLIVTASGQRLWGPEPKALRDVQEGAEVGFSADVFPASGSGGFAFFARPRDPHVLRAAGAVDVGLPHESLAGHAATTSDRGIAARRARSGIDDLVHDLARAEIGMTFNQYAESGPDDVEGAAAVRVTNLHAYLTQRRNAGILVIGGAATHGGSRWSGIAFTSERDLVRWGEPFRATCAVRRWSERASVAVHNVLEEAGVEHRVILWNVVPTVPYVPGRPRSGRRPTATEIELGVEFVSQLRALVEPRVVIAVGKLAHEVLGADVTHIHHPSTTDPSVFAGELGAALAYEPAESTAHPRTDSHGEA
jgi:uracil-DNA glycosylase